MLRLLRRYLEENEVVLCDLLFILISRKPENSIAITDYIISGRECGLSYDVNVG